MNKVYSRINWKNYPSEDTAVNETNLNKIDLGLDNLDNRVIEMNATKVNVEVANALIKNWSIDEKTGIITIEKLNGEKILFDLNIEKIPVSFSLSEDGILTMTTDDGTQFTANIGAMIPVLTFDDSDEIAVSVSGTGVNKTYSFSIKAGSVTEDKLQPNFLADIKVQVSTSEQYVGQAKSYRDETKVLRDEVASDKETIDQTIKESLLEKSEEILAAMKDYYDRAQELYNSMYIDCDGETPQQRVVTIVSIDCGTPQSRLHDTNGILFNGGTPLNRQLAS